jgi:hemoglobin
MHDIESRQDIDALMRLFYSKAMQDDRIGYFFTDVAKLDLEHHLPIIGDFWESLLLGGPAYRLRGRSPLVVHAELDAKEPLLPAHFERWLELFRASIAELFTGPRAEFARLRSEMIARRMIEFVAESRVAAVNS